LNESPIDRVLSRLDKVRKVGPDRWAARCPAHEDRAPSLSVRAMPDGRVLLHCFVGCSTDAVVQSIGLELADLFPAPLESGYAAVKRPFPPGDVLAAVAFEASVILAAARDMLEAGDLVLGHEGFERLALAHDRIQSALTVAGMRHG
jgi:hypothetical protein